MENGNNGNLLVGNTNTTKRPVPAQYWCFTLNNYTVDELEELKKVNGKYVIGFEGKTATPHLQGYIAFKKKCRPSESVKNKRIHWEKRRGTQKEAIAYCQKELDWISTFEVIYDLFDHVTPHKWQQDILDIIKDKPDDRKILWYWESIGNVGKTALAKHMVLQHDAIYVQGKCGDIKYALSLCKESPKIIIFDLTRSQGGHVSYDAIESIKNGIFFSTKYESTMVVWNTPHIIVFANFEPIYEKLSQDRWLVKHLCN